MCSCGCVICSRHNEVWELAAGKHYHWLSQIEDKKANAASAIAPEVPQQLIYKTTSVPRVSFANDAGTIFLRQLQVLDRDAGPYQGAR